MDERSGGGDDDLRAGKAGGRLRFAPVITGSSEPEAFGRISSGNFCVIFQSKSTAQQQQQVCPTTRVHCGGDIGLSFSLFVSFRFI